MRYGILSDIHGNLEALEAVIQSCTHQGVRQFFCLGDVVGYGANPNECVLRLKALKSVCITGNHDWAVIGKFNTSTFNDFAKKAVLWSQQNISDETLEFLNSLSLIYNHDEFVLVHGSLDQPEQFFYIQDISDTGDTFYLMKQKLCFIGHTHIPQIYIKRGENVSLGADQTIHLERNVKYIINIGSVGQPRDGNPQAAYCIYDPDLERIEIKRVAYNVSLAGRKIIEAGLPEMLARRLTIGQ